MRYLSTGAPGVYAPIFSIVHVIVLLIFLVLLNMGIAGVLNKPVFHLFEWFNHISLFWKIVLLFPGGCIVVEMVMRLRSLTKTTIIVNNFKRKARL